MPDLETVAAGPTPQHDDYPTTDDYLHAWYLWRALRRDAELADAERAAKLWALVEYAGFEDSAAALDMVKPY